MAKAEASFARVGVDGRMTVKIVRASAICAEAAQKYGGGLRMKVVRRWTMHKVRGDGSARQVHCVCSRFQTKGIRDV
jgi:hypothetical protein